MTIWWKFFEKEEKIVFKLDEPVDYLDKGFFPHPETELKESIRYLEFLFRTKSREGSKGEPAFNKDCSGPLEADLLGQGHWKGLKII